jgi:Tol biopolymer transport system component
LGGETQKPLPKGNFVVGTSAGLYLLNLAGDTEKLIASNAGFSDPKVSPDGLHIAALRTDWITKQTQMALVDPAGGIKPLVPDGGGLFLAAAWSPDAKTLALTRVTDTNGDGLADNNDATSLVLYDVASGKQQNIGEGGFAAWSPDGVRLALILSGPPGTDLDPTTHQLQRSPNAIGVYNFTSKARRTLLEAKGLEVTLDSAGFTPIPPDLKLGVRYFKAVSWHPDSQHITASADVTGPTGLRAGVIMTLTLDNTTPKVVTAAGDAAGKVSWASDGKHLAFETWPQFPVGPKSANQVALLENASPQNTAPTKILLGNPATRSETRAPQWVADGQTLAFLESDNSILTLAGSDGQNLRRLISGCNGFDWF